MFDDTLRCRFCGGDPFEPDHESRCDGRQGGVDDNDPPPVLNFDQAQDERDTGIARVEAASNEAFIAAALDAIYRLALTRDLFCSDDVWSMRPAWPHTRDRRVLGAVMHMARRQQWIEPTDIFRPTSQVASHASPMRFWRSRLYVRASA